MPDQVIANEYLPGQGISAHVDCVPCFDDTIVSISLLSTCEMVFRELRGPDIRSVVLQPCSVVLLGDAGRYDWSHEIPSRKSDVVNGLRPARRRRVSLTFRKVIHAKLIRVRGATDAPGYPYSAPPGPDKVRHAPAALATLASSPSRRCR
ncbi:alpha-ketoglutarate-dependent dioxygenase AlkB [Agrobacterium tumefaciens]|uniref:alpha-ketoglutarate-dependent dioxygenase AlkB n=1 Tax=Agrobacterium tumefaciens TaxID=358 RepID=UPI001F3AD3C1|nr:alpha-ketoglutarate-dependent dioxygenase AlkB [Agrobacterium tumefaciens]WCK13419.1 alpha-ketoglutarate-dependent dioxygenase AlkB [Agrobacterium tumefaciens]